MTFRSFRNQTDCRAPWAADPCLHLAWLISVYARSRPWHSAGLIYPFWDCFLDNQPPQWRAEA
jgi:hypothetical protein